MAKKITELNALTSVDTDDILVVVDNSASETKKITVANFKRASTFSIPYFVLGTATASWQYQLADENSGNRVRIYISVPSNWDGSTDITIKLSWQCSASGVIDLETYKWYADPDGSETMIENWTDNNINPGGANVVKEQTITLAAANIAAGRYMSVYVRRNTGDANTGTATLDGCNVTTKLNF